MNVYVRQLARGLDARGIEVDVFTRRTEPLGADIVSMGPRTRLILLSGGPARTLPKRILPLHVPEMACSLARFAEREHRRYDLVQSHYWVSGLVAERFRIAIGERPPLVQMFHTLAKLKASHTGADDSADSALRMDAERRLIRRADAVVGNTDSELQELETLYGQSPRLYRVIPPGVDLNLFRPTDCQMARVQLGIDADRVILFVGRFDRLKGVDILLRAVAGLPTSVQHGLKVVLVGGNTSTDRAEALRYMRLAAALGVDHLVDSRGLVPQEELPPYYSAADVCAVPSAYESFGMTAIEAMACETPVVAFRVGGPATTVNYGKTGFLATPGSVENYGSRLLESLTTANLRTMGRRARFSVRGYTWDNTVEQSLRLFDELDVVAVSRSRHSQALLV